MLNNVRRLKGKVDRNSETEMYGFKATASYAKYEGVLFCLSTYLPIIERIQ